MDTPKEITEELEMLIRKDGSAIMKGKNGCMIASWRAGSMGAETAAEWATSHPEISVRDERILIAEHCTDEHHAPNC